MRLIHTTTLTTHEFPESARPAYAILSHRWTDSEVTYQDFAKGRNRTTTGHGKIADFCAVARARGLEYAWADTCCIDKRSSAELSEAINSMFAWYRGAAECYVYLADVWSERGDDRMTGDEEMWVRFRESEWFTRGWTLQELIAPQCLRFYTRDWKAFGKKGGAAAYRASGRRTMSEGERLADCVPGLDMMLEKITGVPFDILLGGYTPPQLSQNSVAQRLSWLAGRRTSRVEDMAYCVLGLFGISLPLLYGEGKNAWMRLQEEIIRTTHDESIFMWSIGNWPTGASHCKPLLSTSPAEFKGCGNISATYQIQRHAYSITNQGLELRLRAGTVAVHPSRSPGRWQRIFVLPLNCTNPEDPVHLCSVMLLEKSCGHFERLACSTWYLNQPLSDFFRGPLLLQEDVTIYVHTVSSCAGIPDCDDAGQALSPEDIILDYVPTLRWHLPEAIVRALR